MIQRDRGASGLADAFAHTYWWGIGFAAAALVPALLLPRRPVGD